MNERFTGFLLLTAIVCVVPARAGATDELEKNKAVVRKVFEEGLTQGKWDVFLAIHAPEFISHAGKRNATLEEDLESAKGWREAFPDLVMSVEQMVAEGDRVAVFFSGQGTNTGTGNGLPATGKHAEGTGMTVFRIANGKIAEEWTVSDQYGLLRQLGLIPAATAK
jgi:steroid delta-isomerase-like uncharacterized protein